jgi:hypothetical protein
MGQKPEKNGRSIESNSPLFFYIKNRKLLAIHLGLDPHHILEPTYFLNQYKGSQKIFKKQLFS